jgi:hypothetical protein
MIYINLFLCFFTGANTLRPWGAVQSYCCGFSRLTQKKLKDTLPTVPFFDDLRTKDQINSINSLSLVEQHKLLLSKLNSLELFLQEYVVDVQYLNRIRDNINNTGEKFDNQNTNNSLSSTTLETIPSQQQKETLEITMPSNLTQSSTTDSTSQSSIVIYTTDTSHDDSSQQTTQQQ